jgi:hypothetical protein
LTRPLALIVRAVFAGFFLLTSIYCLLVFVPFTYEQVVKGELLPPLNRFARLQPYLYWIVLLVVAPITGLGRTRLSSAFCLCHILLGVYLLRWPLLTRLESNSSSLAWALAHMVSIVWLAALDWQKFFPKVQWKASTPDEERAVFQAAWRSALFLAAVYGGIVLWKRQPGEWSATSGWFAFAVSVVSHLLVFLLLFVLLNLLTVIANWFGCPPRAQFVLSHLFGAAMLWLVFRVIVFPAITFSGTPATLYAVSFAVTVSAFISGFSLRWGAGVPETPSGFALAFWHAPGDVRRRGWIRLAAEALVLAAIAAVLAVTTSRLDWNFLVQKLAVLVIWVATFRLFYVSASHRHSTPSPTGRLLSCALLVLPAYRIHEATRTFVWKHTGNKTQASEFLNRWAGYDVSFKLIHDMLSVESGNGDFYGFLIKNTNIPRSIHIAPVPVELADLKQPAAGKKPNIFMVVVDSLRRDYLSPYNSRVDFTPSVERFAKESVVMENAFTHYGGTGLSEPSIWVGGMMVHKQYVTPFAPMNTLQKLLEAESYRAFISRDTILQTVVTPWPLMTELDEGRNTMNYDLCASLQELEGRLEREPRGKPLFSYTQPQNIHISVINRDGAKPISNEDYKSFYAPYASRLRRIDGCFGGFIDKLKALGIYDSSIVILTADHGDSLGEQGRWGHAYTIYPEIVKIPLIIHVPEEIRKTLFNNPKTIAFSTDITPTLYYLTGHKPANKNELLGRPLFTERPEEQTALRRDDYLIASSYGAVYGILTGDGGQLSVSDAVNYKDYAFDLGALFSGAQGLSGSTKTSLEKAIQQKVLALDKFYGYTPADAGSAH